MFAALGRPAGSAQIADITAPASRSGTSARIAVTGLYPTNRVCNFRSSAPTSSSCPIKLPPRLIPMLHGTSGRQESWEFEFVGCLEMETSRPQGIGAPNAMPWNSGPVAPPSIFSRGYKGKRHRKKTRQPLRRRPLRNCANESRPSRRLSHKPRRLTDCVACRDDTSGPPASERRSHSFQLKPRTGSVAPWTPRAASEARNRITSATASGATHLE